MASSRFSKRELNHLRVTYVVVKLFPCSLRTIFKDTWQAVTGFTWTDDIASGQEFWQRESQQNRARNKDKLRIITRGDSRHFDCTNLFYCILFSNSIGAYLRRCDCRLYRAVDKLRRLRNELFHRPNLEVPTRELDVFLDQASRCYRTLGFNTNDLDNAKKKADFNSRDVERLRQLLRQEKRRLRNYENYILWKASYFNEFSQKYSLSTRKLKENGILNEEEAARVDSERNSKVKKAIIIDCVLHKGLQTTATFLAVLHKTDASLAETFKNTLPWNFLEDLTTVSPRVLQKATSEYPTNYTTMMKGFTQCIYSMDWEGLNHMAQSYLQQSSDWSVKLFVKIELAYGYNVQGESEKAIALLDEVTRNASKAGANCGRILARTFARKSLHYIHVHEFSKAEYYGTEAKALISSCDCPEEEIVCTKRLTDCILYEDGTVEERRRKAAPLYSQIIDMCQRHINDIPRCVFYLRFIYHDMARLCLGFTKNGFIESTHEEIEEGLKHIERLEQPDLKIEEENTYTDAFRFICKSLAALKIGKGEEGTQREKMLTEGLEYRDRATSICHSLNAGNNEAMFMLDSLNEYIAKLRI